MTREEQIEIMMECISEYASTIPGYMEEDYQKAINIAFQEIERAEKEERREAMIDRKAIHDLVDKALDVQEQTKRYVSVTLSNFGSDIDVYAIAGGWRKDDDFDLSKNFCREGGGAKYDVAMAYLDSLLKEEPRTGGAAGAHVGG